MNLDYKKYLKEKKEVVSVALLGISAFLAVLMLIKVVGFFAASASAESVVTKAVAQSKTSDKDVEKLLAKSKTVADELKMKNLFVPPPPKEQPIKEVWGILGDEVLINDKWYKVGDTIQDAKIVAIEPAQVKITWDGKDITLAPIDAGSSSGPSEGGPGRPERGVTGAGGARPDRAEMVVVRSEAGPMPGREGAFGGRMRGPFGDMSEEQRDRMRAEMRAMRERFMNASPEERERLRDEMRARFSERFGRRGGPGGRGQ
jgi:hypothetical protein